MEIAWKVANLFVGLLVIELCSGFPIGLENSAADYHTQFLTGLVGVLLTVCGVVFLVGCLCCQRKNGFKEFHNSPVVASSTSSLDHGHINPIANGEFTIFTPLSPPHHNNNVFLANEQIVGRTEIDYNHADIDVHSWFDGTERDFPRTKLKYIKELGKGWFGRVVEGTAQGLSSDTDEGWVPVAVRILEASATSSERAVFLHDATIYHRGTHPHTLQLLGRSLESVPLLLLQELCPRGDLKKYLKDNHGTAEKLLSSDLPLLWCCQLSSALKHLHDHRLTHPDLAARNCQVVSDLSLKLGDYGLAASLYPEDYYQGAPAVPVRWCAPESLTYTSTTIQPKQTTFESNVWSLGVTMWEIYECGAQPYAHLSDDDVISQVLGSSNVRLAKPDFSMLYTDYIFRLMQLCWSTSESRPSVSQIYLMLTDLMQVYQNTKHITHSEPLSIQDFDKRWDTFKPNTVSRTDNQDFIQEDKSLADIDLSDITILNINPNKEELSSTKPMSPSLNNLHGSLDNLAGGEMDSWLQKVAHKTGDMSYVRGLSEAIKDLDNALALENVSSSDSSHQPSPAPENLPVPRNKLEFKLGPTAKTWNDSSKTQNSSLTESMQRTSSESETEDENWRRKVEQGVYSEKVHQKSKSVTDLMILTHIDCSESDSDTPLPSLDYRVNYRNVRYAPKQNLENASLMFGSEGNLLSVHDKFQEELKRLQEERKDSLLFVPEYISHRDDKCSKSHTDQMEDPHSRTENSSSDEDVCSSRRAEGGVACTYVNTNPSVSMEQLSSNSKNVSPNHRNPESLIEELSSPADIQPGSQVYNIFNVTVDSNFSPMHIRPDLKDIICFEESETNSKDDFSVETAENTITESPSQCFQVPKLTELIQNNDDLMDYIITKYESQENLNINSEITVPISENNQHETDSSSKELNNNVRDSAAPLSPNQPGTLSESFESIQSATQAFLRHEQENQETPPIPVQFDVSHAQAEVCPSTMTHSAIFCSTPFAKRDFESVKQDRPCINFELSPENEDFQFSSNFADLEEDVEAKLKYSLETWDNFLGKALEGSRAREEGSGFEEFSSEPQSLLFVDGKDALDSAAVECKNRALIENFNWKNDLKLEADSEKDQEYDLHNSVQNVNIENEECSVLNIEEEPEAEDGDKTFTVGDNTNRTFVCEDKENEEEIMNESAKINDVTVVLDNSQLLNKTYNKEGEGGSSNWEPGEGWFLHPQTNTEVSGQMEIAQSGDTESYVRFSMDDEIMAAIRNELLMKLPQAQGQSSEQLRESDEWDAEGRSEVLIKYNVYTTPLSPIPEESCSENDSHHFIYNRQDSSSNSENGDWPEPYEEHHSCLADTESRSIQNIESPIQEPPHRHTPSQDSCCSNDTLFNLEELTYALNESESILEKRSDVFEETEFRQANQTDSKDIEEESTLKAERKDETEMGNTCDKAENEDVEEVQQNGTNDDVHIIYSRNVEILPLALSEANITENDLNIEGRLPLNVALTETDVKDDTTVKNTNIQKTEILTCNNIDQNAINGEEQTIDRTEIGEMNKDTVLPLNEIKNMEVTMEEVEETKVADENKNEELAAVTADNLLKISVNVEERVVNNPEEKTESTGRPECNSVAFNLVDVTEEPNNVSCSKPINIIEDVKSISYPRMVNTNDVCNQVENMFIHSHTGSKIETSIESLIDIENGEVNFNKNEISMEENSNVGKINRDAIIYEEKICNLDENIILQPNIDFFHPNNQTDTIENSSLIDDMYKNNFFIEEELRSDINNHKNEVGSNANISMNGAETIIAIGDVNGINVTKSEVNDNRTEIDTVENSNTNKVDEDSNKSKINNNIEVVGNEVSVNKIELDIIESEVSDNENDTIKTKVCLIEKDSFKTKSEVSVGVNGVDANSRGTNANSSIESVFCPKENKNSEKREVNEVDIGTTNNRHNILIDKSAVSVNKNETDADEVSMKIAADIDEIGINMDTSEETRNDATPCTNKANIGKSQINDFCIVKNEINLLSCEGDIAEVGVIKSEANIGKCKINDNQESIKVSAVTESEICTDEFKDTNFDDSWDFSEEKVDHVNISFIKNKYQVRENSDISEGIVSINKNVENESNSEVGDKVIVKNVQNGIMPLENSPKWIDDINSITTNENETLHCNSINDKLENTESSNSLTSQTKETKETEQELSFSLLVENNPNYITEFLNHERQSSISSLGSSRDDDDEFTNHVSISLQNNKNETLITDNNELSNLHRVTERDYVNINDISIKFVDESSPDIVSYDSVSRADCTNDSSQPEYVNIVQEDMEDHLYDPVASDSDIYDALSDIRFTGPSDIQLMSTSFSESADIDDQDWDSGSDTRSSSSGEFIWKEGEHEESVKALRAAPQDVGTAERINPLEDIEEVTSESSDEDEEGDSPEFVPSAWDKYATPTKSALRSPEKSLEKSEVKHKKPKGVWFKKQKYHCVYEYPREPESPNVNSYELWQPVSTSLIDWEVDTSPYIPTLDGTDTHPDSYQHFDKHARNLYQLTDFTTGMTALDDEFFISSTARPFETFGGLSSQFFPGQNISDQWMDLTRQASDNITPDSGVEDITPAGNIDEFLQATPKSQVQSLKALAGAALKQNQISDFKSNNKGSMGGLRHARNKLKLDLPPSPSAFTSTKAFTIEPPEEPVTKREVPTFTTFGKSRFLVQHVDTPTCDEENESKNVSFEALPYKPMQIAIKGDKAMVEIVRGEASLLDSADEDSGIESSTLERKKITNVAD